MKHYFNFEKEIKEPLIARNPELVVYDWDLIQAMYFMRYGNQFTIQENLAIFKGQLKNFLFVSLTKYLIIMKSNKYLNTNLENILEFDDITTSQETKDNTIAQDGSTHSFIKNDPHNQDNDVYLSGTLNDGSTHSKQKQDGTTASTSSKVNNANKIKLLKEIYEYFHKNNVYQLIIESLEPLFRFLITDTMMQTTKRNCCTQYCKPNFCLGINYVTIDDVQNMIDEALQDGITEIDLEFVNEVVEDGAVILDGEVKYVNT